MKKDFELYQALVKKGGSIGFHDIVQHPDYCVETFWNEIKQEFKAQDFVESREQEGFGIGVIKV